MRGSPAFSGGLGGSFPSGLGRPLRSATGAPQLQASHGPGRSHAKEAESMELGGRPADSSHSLSTSLPLSSLTSLACHVGVLKCGFYYYWGTARPTDQESAATDKMVTPSSRDGGTDGGQVMPAKAARGHRGWSGSRGHVAKGLY